MADIVSLVQAGKYQLAVQEVTRSMSIEPHSPHLWTNRGSIYYVFVERNCIPLIGQNAGVLVLLFDQSNRITTRTKMRFRELVDGTHQAGLERCLDEAELCLTKAIELGAPSDSTVYNWRAQVYFARGRFSDAVKDLEFFLRGNAEKTDPFIAGQTLTARNIISRIDTFDWDAFNRIGESERLAANDIAEPFGAELRGLLKQIDLRNEVQQAHVQIAAPRRPWWRRLW